MAIETELKFRLPARDLTSFTRSRLPRFRKGRVEHQNLDTTYFDTAKHKLKRRGMSLRIRQSGDKKIQTVKAGDRSSIGRGEWETEVRYSKPNIKRASSGTPLRKFAARKLRKKLKPVFRTLVHRTVVPLQTRRAEIEVAVDHGKIVSGRRESPLAEIELELKSGPSSDLFHLAREIERRSRAELYLPSKAERGYYLANNDTKLMRFAEPISLRRGTQTIDAFRMILYSTMRHFANNADAVRSGDSEGIHQMRVGLRRTRAAISVFSAMLPKARTERIKSGLKWLTNELAPARELDVFLRKKIDPAGRGAITTRGARSLKSEFTSKRREAIKRATTAVNSSRYRHLLIDILEWLEIDVTRRSAATGQAIEDFAKEILRRRLKTIHKDGKRLDRLSARERHKLRIKTKKIRYALEFFHSLFPRRRDHEELTRLSGKLKTLQGALGSLNDFAAHRDMTREAALGAPRAHRRARAVMLGVVLGKEEEATKPVLQTAARAVGRLGPVSAF